MLFTARHFIAGLILCYLQIESMSMKKKLFLGTTLTIAVVTNAYALVQVSGTHYDQDIIRLLTWAIVAMGTALVSVLVYFFTGLKADVADVKRQINTEIAEIKTSLHGIDRRLVATEVTLHIPSTEKSSVTK